MFCTSLRRTRLEVMGARKNGALEGKTPLPSLVPLAHPVLSWAVTSKRLLRRLALPIELER